jgi:hypothetical protein
LSLPPTKRLAAAASGIEQDNNATAQQLKRSQHRRHHRMYRIAKKHNSQLKTATISTWAILSMKYYLDQAQESILNS